MIDQFELDDGIKSASYQDDKDDVVVQITEPVADTSRHHLHRKLTPRHLQLITIAGGIGSALFVLIGTALVSGGPVPLVLGMLFWCSVIWAVSNFQMEITTLLPLDGGFMAHASRFVDPAFGCAVGYNYFITSAAILNYEITILNVVLSYWFNDLNPAIVISILLVVFAALNVWTVKWFGEVEFWVAIGKILLVFGLAFFTLVTMCGGNPIHDKYGFRYWRDPSPWVGASPFERLQALWSTIIFAAFSIVGPDFMSLMAGEVKNPRRVLPGVYKSTTFRLLLFYGLGAFCVATVCASDDEQLLSAIKVGSAGAAKSPYVVAMKRLQIPYLGSIVNAAVLVSLLSTANTFVFTTSRSLHGLALAGQAPSIFRRLNRMGVPYVSVGAALALGCLSYLQMSAGTYKVLGWWVNITTCSEILTWVVMGITYVFFDRALKAQGLHGSGFLPIKARWPLASAWYVIVVVGFTCIFQAYTIMSPSTFDGLTFFFAYAAIFIFIAIFVGWKLVKRTSFVRPDEADLISDIASLDAYTEECEAELAQIIQPRLDRFINLIF